MEAPGGDGLRRRTRWLPAALQRGGGADGPASGSAAAAAKPAPRPPSQAPVAARPRPRPRSRPLTPRQRVAALLSSPWYLALMVLFTLYSLFGEDVRVAASPKS
jgi:hypothetical protein